MTKRDSFKTGGGLSDLGEFLSANDSLIDQHVGSYRITGLIAEGGMGRVYRAIRADGQFERNVAIKTLPPGRGEEYLLRFKQEQRILAGLAHPNIAQLLDAGVTDAGIPYLVMELIEGHPIDEAVRRPPLSIRRKTELMLTLADTLAFAHSRLVVHRDLKPSNVFVAEAGQLKLLDFGIAKILEAPDSLTEESRPLTPSYASPEQLLDEPVSVASDVYQFGLLFLSLFEHRDDAQKDTWSSAIARASRGDSVTVAQRLATRLPAELGAIINRCLRAEREERYASADALAADLRNYLGGYPVMARDPGAFQRAGKFLRRNWLASTLTLGIVTVLVVGTTAYVRSIEAERQAVLVANEQAKLEAATAQSLNDFLLEMISGANVFSDASEPITVLEAVVSGAELAERQLADQPLVRARLLNALAGTLSSMGEWSSSRDMLQAAMPALIDHPELTFTERSELRSHLAYATYRLSDFDAAREQYDALTRLYEQTGKTNDTIYANAWRRLGLLERRAANYDLAIEHMAKAQTAYAASDASDQTLAGFAGDHGLVLSHRDKESALERYDESLRLFKNVQGEDCPSCAITQSNRAWVLRELGQYEAALAALRSADETFVRQMGADYGSRQGSLLFEMAAVLNDMGRYEQADQHHQRASQVYLKAFGRNHSAYALSLYGHAQTHRDHGRCDLSLPLLYEARDIHLELFGEASEWVAKDDQRIAQCEETHQSASDSGPFSTGH